MDDISTMLRDSAADFLASRHDLARLKGAIGEPRALDRKLWREMAELGWLGLGLSQQFGGDEIGLREVTVLCEQFGRTAFALPYIEASLIPALILSATTLADLTQSLAEKLQSGTALLTLAWQEQVGEFENKLPTTHFDGAAINGKKLFVAAVEADSVLLVTARAHDELTIVAVAANAPGVSWRDFAAGQGTVSTVSFENSPILGSAPLLTGVAAQHALQRALDAGRIALSAQLSGLASAMLERTIKFVNERVQFARPIGSFQTIRHRCVDLYIATQLAGATWRDALAVFEKNNAQEIAIAASAAKARCADTAQRVAREAIQMHGAMGFTEEADIGLFARASLQGYAALGSPLQHRRRFLQGQTVAMQELAYG
ncbi:MAG: acyl-CoA dehydrogenase [Verrucomicrobiaceae bacterium]|nr:acyl-CoA dehydrogenase [Verrucomicrobiaceae bacterium]